MKANRPWAPRAVSVDRRLLAVAALIGVVRRRRGDAGAGTGEADAGFGLPPHPRRSRSWAPVGPFPAGDIELNIFTVASQIEGIRFRT